MVSLPVIGSRGFLRRLRRGDIWIGGTQHHLAGVNAIELQLSVTRIPNVELGVTCPGHHVQPRQDSLSLRICLRRDDAFGVCVLVLVLTLATASVSALSPAGDASAGD